MKKTSYGYQEDQGGAWLFWVGGAIGLTVVAALTWLMYAVNRPPNVDQARVAERLENLRAVEDAGAQGLTNYAHYARIGTNDVFSLPIERAMEILVSEWRDPAEGRAQLMERVDLAHPEPPPPPEPPPAAPSPFE